VAIFGRKVDPVDWWQAVHALQDELATAGHQAAATRLHNALTVAATTSTELYYECLDALGDVLRLIPASEVDRRVSIQMTLDDGRSFFDPRSINYLFRR
jgi:hypothetical protein